MPGHNALRFLPPKSSSHSHTWILLSVFFYTPTYLPVLELGMHATQSSRKTFKWTEDDGHLDTKHNDQ